MLIERDHKMDSIDPEYMSWGNGNELWISADPQSPTYRAGAVADAMVLAAGAYPPEEILPSEAATVKETGSAEHCPAYVTGEPFIGDHMVLTLELPTRRPDVGID